MAVYKPKGIHVHPENHEESGTLLNLLFQHNRWLAEMETSITAGVLHRFHPNDHGLMIFNKNDEYADTLKQAIDLNEMNYFYTVVIERKKLPSELPVKVLTQKEIGNKVVVEIQTTNGNTFDLRERLFPQLNPDEVIFYCHKIQLVLPHTGARHTLALRETNSIPEISFFYAPP
ncbi:pseudouridine synthase [Bacillus pinisoli]|uniref:pseudouridine synthase n=1 Tax=Bacillus pinisoli TaxID=2901866 RepID=UPI001FF5F77A|nr:pseudouridine synthase [Bacillus pinisoli]